MIHAKLGRRKFFVLGAAVVLFTLARFIDLSSAPFINDEPQLQMILDQHLAAHTLPQYGLMGTRGVVYGPTALWIYLPLRLITDDVLWITAYHALIHCGGLLLVFLAIRSSAGLETALWALLLISSSPYLFFYSRLPWDNTFLIPLTGLTLFCLARLERDAGRLGAWMGLGLATGLVFNLHLMALPVIIAAALVVLPIAWRNRHNRRVWIGLTLAPLTQALTVTPYMQVVWHSLRQSSAAEFTKEALSHALPDTLRGTATYLSASGMEYFLTDATSVVIERLGPFALGPRLAWIVCWAAWSWLAISSVRAGATWLRDRSIALRVFPAVAQFGVAYFLLLAFYYYLIRPHPFHPHYFMSTYWLLPFFAAWLATESSAWTSSVSPPTAETLGQEAPTLTSEGPSDLKARWARFVRHAPVLSGTLKGVIALLALSNVAFVATAYGEISRGRGTREVHYSSTRAEVERATRRMCKLARTRGRSRLIADLNAAPGVLSPPFKWFVQHLPECTGITLDFGAASENSAPDTLAVRLSYATQTARSARLVVRAW